MRVKILFISIIFSVSIPTLFGQNYPWERPLKIAWSNDGVTFNTPAIFQDSSGVPCVIRWKGDTLICAFQWFRAPVNSASWDRVAVKFSYDNGLTWTNPVPIIVNGLPVNYQRPFDPTLAVFNNDSIRVYFSSSDGMPGPGQDSIINTYSAKSADGINYTFEPNARVDVDTNRVIDPAVIFFNGIWHYLSHVGSPQQGAYHFVGPDGVNFSSVPLINSDNIHSWLGNYMVNGVNDLRFYGSSPSFIWYNSSPNGGMWNGYVNTNITGGDPSALKVSTGNYLMIFTGEPYTTGVSEISFDDNFNFFPNPAGASLSVSGWMNEKEFNYIVYSAEGKIILQSHSSGSSLSIKNLSPGIYFLELQSENQPGKKRMIKFIKD